MYNEISQFEPLYPAETGALEDLAVKLYSVSAQLEGRLSPITLGNIKALLRVTNSYYSNLIEGHNTHPIDILRAMRREYSTDDDKRDLQIESLIHIDVQKKIIERLKSDPGTNVSAPEFLLRIHREFYEEMPERLRWIKAEGSKDESEAAWVEAGEFRTRQVAVGRHVPPISESLMDFLKRFGSFYDPARISGLRPVIALAAAHHRLMWIHPFLDGNGRVARLFTDAYFYRINFPGYGLWNVSRGLARRRKSYRANLAAADHPRVGDLDGRGNLSNRTLTEFCLFFLETCIDQAEFMNSMLALDRFYERLEKYVENRNAGRVVDEKGKPFSPLPVRTTKILKEVATKGEMKRGEIYRIIEMSESTGRRALKSLFDAELLVTESDWHRAPVRLGFPAQFAAYVFPNLFPESADYADHE